MDFPHTVTVMVAIAGAPFWCFHGTCIPMEYDKMEDKQLQETSNDEHCWQGIDEWG